MFLCILKFLQIYYSVTNTYKYIGLKYVLSLKFWETFDFYLLIEKLVPFSLSNFKNVIFNPFK